MFQPRQNDLLARLLNLAGEKDLVKDGVDLVKVEDEVELADVAEEGVEDLDEEVDGLEEGELVVIGVDAGAEEEAGVAAVDDLVVAELDKVGLVLLVAGGDEAVDLALELDLFVVAVGGVPFREAGFAPVDSGETRRMVVSFCWGVLVASLGMRVCAGGVMGRWKEVEGLTVCFG